MSFQTVIEEIFSGLTGDNKADIAYLQEQAEAHKDDENALEILRAIGRKTYELLPDDKKSELSKVISNSTSAIEATIQEAVFQIQQNHDSERGMELFHSVLEVIESMFKEDDECIYLCFDNIIQDIVYKTIFKPEKTVRTPTFDYAMIYYMYGYCLIDNNRLDEGEQALKTANKWNPVSSQIMFELGEIYKTTKRYDEYIYWTKEALKYAMSAKSLARAYRNLGYYYIEIEKYDIAANLFYFSELYEENTTAKSELFYISEKIGKVPDRMGPDRLKELFEKEKIQFCVNPDVASTIYSLGNMFEENEKYNAALGCYEMLRDVLLGKDEHIEGKIEAMNGKVTE